MNRLHIVHHGMGGFRPFRALFLVLIGFLMGLGIAQGEKGCKPTVWLKNYPPPNYGLPPSNTPASPAAAPGSAGPR